MAIIEWMLINTRATLWNDKQEHDFKTETLMRTCEENGFPLSMAEFEQRRELCFQQYTTSIYESIVWQTVQPDIAAYERIIRSFQKRYAALSAEDWRKLFNLNQGALRVMHTLSRSYQLALAEESTRQTRVLLEHAGLLAQFSLLNLPETSRFQRPDTRFYQYLLEKMDTSPDRVVLVSAHYTRDIVPALWIGMKTVLFKRGREGNQPPRLPAEMPHIELDALSKLPDAVKTLELMT